MHIYAFGSVCRGEVDSHSDIDLLALVGEHDPRFDPSKYSIYSYKKMRRLWDRGSPFAWHLALEARLLFASDEVDVLKLFAMPAAYVDYLSDCEKFQLVFRKARESLLRDDGSRVFDLSSIFLSIRNLATCFSLGVLGKPRFSRGVAMELGELNVPLSEQAYITLEGCRILCTRSIGPKVENREVQTVLKEIAHVEEWINDLVRRAAEYERICKSS